MKVVNNLLKYKNFSGLIGHSEADGSYFGRILGIEELVTFKAKNRESLEAAFYEAVDNYLFMHNDTYILPTCRVLLSEYVPPSRERTAG